MREDDVLLTVKDVRLWKQERDSLTAEIAGLQEKADEIARRLALVSSFLSPETKALLFGEDLEPARQDLTGWVRALLNRSEGPMTLRQMLDAAVGTEFEDRIRRNSNSLYNTTARLVERGEAKRIGKLVVSTAVYDRLVAQGRNPEVEFRLDEEMTGPQRIAAMLRGHADGLSPGEIVAQCRTDPVISAKVERNPQYVYTVLSRMLKRGELVRTERGYNLADIEAEVGDDDSNDNETA